MRPACSRISSMGFNKRRMESERAAVAAKEAEARRALGRQILEDAKRLVSAWNARQEARMPMLFSPTIGAALTARYWFLWVSCPACRTTPSIDLRALDRHPDGARDQSRSGALVPIVPAPRAVRRARAAVETQHRRRRERLARSAAGLASGVRFVSEVAN
jgi:hypothetical protein